MIWGGDVVPLSPWSREATSGDANRPHYHVAMLTLLVVLGGTFGLRGKYKHDYMMALWGQLQTGREALRTLQNSTV